jgi:phosphinothricin acetyltransferase
MEIRKAEIEDLKELTDLYNYEVIHGVSTLDLKAKTIEERKQWFYDHNINHHPLYVAVVEQKVVGYASLSSYREKEAYKSTVELSIYIDVNYRGQGIASALMEYIIDKAKKDKTIHNVVSVITSGNKASARLHEKFGFEFCGTIKEVGVKFNEYRDIDNYCLIVEEPAN